MHEITLNLPLPHRGRGQERKLKAGVAGNKEGKPPLQAPQWQGKQATETTAPPPGAANARRTGNAGGKPPARHLHGRFCKCRRRSNAGDARGAAPCIK